MTEPTIPRENSPQQNAIDQSCIHPSTNEERKKRIYRNIPRIPTPTLCQLPAPLPARPNPTRTILDSMHVITTVHDERGCRLGGLGEGGDRAVSGHSRRLGMHERVPTHSLSSHCSFLGMNRMRTDMVQETGACTDMSCVACLHTTKYLFEVPSRCERVGGKGNWRWFVCVTWYPQRPIGILGHYFFWWWY
jgi:hypothetical protein